MALKDAGEEIPALALKNGFRVSMKAGSGRIWAMAHTERREAFVLSVDESAGFVSANWFAETEYVTIVDKRAPGERGKEGRSLTANSKRRAVGMDEVRPMMVTSSSGLAIGYMDLKRRIRDADWRER